MSREKSVRRKDRWEYETWWSRESGGMPNWAIVAILAAIVVIGVGSVVLALDM